MSTMTADDVAEDATEPVEPIDDPLLDLFPMFVESDESRAANAQWHAAMDHEFSAYQAACRDRMNPVYFPYVKKETSP